MENMKIVNDTFPFGEMEPKGKGKIALKSVSITGEISGLLFAFNIHQEYKNESEETLEIIYTFPVGWGVTMLGMKARIGAMEFVGYVVDRWDAEELYEKALSSWDSAIMVQKSSSGLYTANLGNIKPGETVSVDLQCARLLNLYQGKARLCVPIAVGERYGDPHSPGGLAEHESIEVDMNAKYPISIRIGLSGDYRDIASPSHPIKVERTSSGADIKLDPGSVMDRDFILTFAIPDNKSIALGMKDGNEYLLAVSFEPRFSQEEREPLGLKILVDCSYSMHERSIMQVKKGLQRITSLLGEDDYVSYGKFGTNVEFPIRKMTRCTPGGTQALSSAINQTFADMGGVELANALKHTLHDIAPKKNLRRVLLLISAGAVWDIKNTISLAKQSNHKIFCIGVGDSRAESPLRDLAKATGGAYEFVTHYESVEDIVIKMFARMKETGVAGIDINWGRTPIWKSKTPRLLYNGEIVHAFALFDKKPVEAPVLSWSVDGDLYRAVAEIIEETENAALARVAANARGMEMGTKKAMRAFALKYQLVSDVTSLILVSKRKDGDKAEGLPEVWITPQPPEFVGENSVKGEISKEVDPDDETFEEDFFVCRIYDDSRICDAGIEERFWRTAMFDNIWESWRSQKLRVRSVAAFLRPILAVPDMVSLRVALAESVAQTKLSDEAVAARFLAWLFEHKSETKLDRHSARIINYYTNKIADNDKKAVNKRLDAWFYL